MKKFPVKATVITVLLCIVALSMTFIATYAWFTNNTQVGTTRVTGRTSVQSVTLELSRNGGSAFRAEADCPIVQVNSADYTKLIPVSTADLQTFVYCAGSEDNMASMFAKVESESNYYHGRIYLRAVSEEGYGGDTVALYLDESAIAGGAIVSASGEDSKVLCAARLGLVLNEDYSSSVIMQLTDQILDEDERSYNTVISGTVQNDPIVLQWNESEAVAVPDPSEQYTNYVMAEGDTELPEKPLFELQINSIYALDVYYYLEGCDPDCTETVSYMKNDFHLAFYGLVG